MPLPSSIADAATSSIPRIWNAPQAADDVDDRVGGTNLVEVHFAGRNPVGRGLGPRDPLEDILGFRGDGLGKARISKDREDVG